MANFGTRVIRFSAKPTECYFCPYFVIQRFVEAQSRYQVFIKIMWTIKFLLYSCCYRYNIARPPNNDRKCKKNPDDREFLRQIVEARHY